MTIPRTGPTRTDHHEHNSRHTLGQGVWRTPRGDRMGLRLQSTDQYANRRRAMTLVELLVVIVLLVTLVSTAIPVISPGGEGRKLREASRGVNAYLQGAQARAIQTGRPFGVALTRLSADTGRAEDNGVCLRLEYVEVPPTYAGFDRSSAARVAINPSYDPTAAQGTNAYGPLRIQFIAQGTTTPSDNLPDGYDFDLIPIRFLRPGDTVEIQGERYTLLNGSGTDTEQVASSGYFEPGSVIVTFAATWTGAVDQLPIDALRPIAAVYDATGNRIASPEAISAANAPYWTAPTPYKIYRQPVPAAGEPYELPSGAAIDLEACAVGATPVVQQFYSPYVDYDDTDGFEDRIRTEPVMILFAPEGNVHRVHGLFDTTVDETVAGTVGLGPMAPQTVTSFLALCVGRREAIPAPLQDPVSRAAYQNPIDLQNDLSGTETEQKEITDQYNWLNLESRWIVIGGQTGSVATIEGVSLFGDGVEVNGSSYDGAGYDTTREQITDVLENATTRQSANAN